MEKPAHPLAQFRETKGMNLTQLAKHLGVSVTIVSRWEAGERKPSSKMLAHIQKKTKITPAQLRPDLVEMLRGAA